MAYPCIVPVQKLDKSHIKAKLCEKGRLYEI